MFCFIKLVKPVGSSLHTFSSMETNAKLKAHVKLNRNLNSGFKDTSGRVCGGKYHSNVDTCRTVLYYSVTYKLKYDQELFF